MTSTKRHLVVDGSNIATEGRSLPSLKQLDEAVRAVLAERAFDSVTVIVDATFAHRIDAAEREEFEAAIEAGELLMPPAGVVGRGDAFILQVAEKAKAAVFSNDSFQEFHGDHGWLFDEGRLVGGKPVEHVGWVFVDRIPVRGPASRRATRESGRSRDGRAPRRTARVAPTSSGLELGPPPKPSAPPPTRRAAASTPSPAVGANASDTNGVEPASAGRSRTPKQRPTDSVHLNEPLAFLNFVSNHSLGEELVAPVDRYSSHGCYLDVDGAQAYLPLKAMGTPPPTKARELVAIGQRVSVRVESLDADRRGINVSLIAVLDRDDPTGAAHEPVMSADDSAGETYLTRSETDVATKRTAAKKAATPTATKAPAKKAAKATASARVKAAPAAKPAAKKAAAKKAAPAAKAPAKKAAPAAKKAAAPAKKAAAKKAAPAAKAPAKKAAPAAKKAAAPAQKAAAKKAAPAAKAPAKKAAAKKAAPAAKAPAKKAAVKKAAAPAKKAAAPKAAKKVAAKKAAPAKKAAKKA